MLNKCTSTQALVPVFTFFSRQISHWLKSSVTRIVLRGTVILKQWNTHAFRWENECVTCSVSVVLRQNKWFYLIPPGGVKLKWTSHVCGQFGWLVHIKAVVKLLTATTTLWNPYLDVEMQDVVFVHVPQTAAHL